ncbi:porin [Vibrio comitans]|uniref:Outer membrane protein N n=1 Tax=Vibrio comitans NBRC 102076 TaxID=1219078 RepID=A0A4Y3IJP6_9VIBR|nr:porin [Vibrio comitans]GEA59681.1 outer membrane protein N [Vibrio comitans NBRC 102076]
MNKKIIALAVAAAAFGTQASAVELYNNDGSTFSIGGHVTAAIQGSEENDASVEAVSPRINFTATQDLGHGFTADARGEWAMNMLEGGDNTFTTRLGYIGVTHEDFGRAVAGTQWSPYYDIAGVADMPIAFANDFLYDNHGKLGTGRADKMVSYRNGFDLGSVGLNIGAGWQGDNLEGGAEADAGNYGNRAQIALSADVAAFTVGYVYNTGNVNFATIAGGSVDANSHAFSAKYGSYGDGLYVAAVYAMNEYMNSYGTEALAETSAYEFLAAYALSNSLNLSINYEGVEDDAASETVRSEMALQAEYNFTNSFVGFAGYQIDLGNDKNNIEDNKYSVGVRYYL